MVEGGHLAQPDIKPYILKVAGTQDFEGSETILYNAITVNTYHYKLVITHGITKQRMIHNVNYELLLIMMCQCGFIDSNRCTLVWNVDGGEGCVG